MYVCPKCGKEIRLSYESQYHNEYCWLHFICDNCGFKTKEVSGYKDFSTQRDRLAKEYNIKLQSEIEKDENNKISRNNSVTINSSTVTDAEFNEFAKEYQELNKEKIEFSNYGWICPICHRVISPFITYCPFCSNQYIIYK